MKRQIGSVMVAVVMMAAGCTAGDVQSVSGEQAAGDDQGRESRPLFSTADTANVLIFGDHFNAMDALRAELESLGHTVTVQEGVQQLPDNLTQFHTIWHVGFTAPMSSDVLTELAAYVAGGGGLHLSGETTGSDTMNDSLTELVQSTVVGASGVQLGRQGIVPGKFGTPYYDINEGAAGSVASDPNTALVLELVGAGGISGLPLASSNTLAIGGFFGDTVVGGIWNSGSLVSGAGSLTVIMDSDWLLKLNDTDNDNAKLVENLQEFLTGTASTEQPPVAVAEIVPDQNLDCDDGSGQPRDTVPVDLDATGSSDPDTPFEELTFTWFERGEVLDTGPTPTVDLSIGEHNVVLVVSDGVSESVASLPVEITCNVTCTPGSGFWTFCHPGCPCDHGEGDCDIDADCKAGLICLHDAGFAFGFEDNEVDVCSTQCPELGVASWNYCSPLCPCDVGEGDCDSDADCLAGLRCERDIGPAFGWDREVDVCEPI